ncbi:MAG: hypothetical protein R6V47_02785 [Candidatus Delongbacteria bacterium]
MKLRFFLPIVTILLIATVLVLLSRRESLDSRLDDLENIITRYEGKFDSVKYGTQDYSDMVKEYNEEIFDWAKEFESERYEMEGDVLKRDKEGKKIPVKEFLEVEDRFYELNNKMTAMVLGSIPKNGDKKRNDPEKDDE